MFNKLREKTGKQFIKKYLYPFGPLWLDLNTPYVSLVTGQMVGNFDLSQPDLMVLPQLTTELFSYGSEDGALGKTTVSATSAGTSSYNTATGQTTEMLYTNTAPQEEDTTEDREAKRAERDVKFRKGFGGTADGTMGSAIGNFASGNWKTGLADTAVAGMKAIDNLAMGDKNFGAQSEAIDLAVHGVSSALMKSGNPYAMAAGAVLEGANFLTKAGGQTVQGFDVDINSSGYGQMGHMESSSSRDFGAMIGLGGLNQKSMRAKLQKRNQQAMMAMNAANIANEQTFEQEARMNSVQNTVMNNQIALAGGLETSLLGG